MARVGGDEFVVLIDAVPLGDTTPLVVVGVAQKILAAMQAPMRLPHGEEVITASIGIAMWPEDGDTTDTLLNRADLAMYKAKKAGGNQFTR